MVRRKKALFAVVLSVTALVLLALFGLQDQVRALVDGGSPGPGLKIQITKVEVGGDRRPVVTFKISDDKGVGLQISDLDGTPRFTIARIDQDATTGLTQYVNYIVGTVAGRPFTFKGETKQPLLASVTQPLSAMDQGGVFVGLGNGVHTYTFNNALPDDFPRNASHAVGGQATRDTRKWAGNDVFYFVPAGGPLPLTREIVKTENCNRCHDPLALHGGSRRDTRLCVLCHTPQNVDPESGNTPDFKVMIHKIHRGENLPSVKEGKPYFIVGNAQNVFDFSDIAWPQDVRNCTTCHTGAAQSDNWKNAPNAAACTACHDKVNPLTGQNHGGGVQTNATCKNCHTSTMVKEFDLSIPGAHLLPTRSQQLRGIEFTLMNVSNTKPGQNPTVQFHIQDKAGNFIAPSEMTRFALLLAGPTTDYQERWQEVVTTAVSLGGGHYSYTFTQKIPESASGTYAVGVEGYLEQTIQGPRGQPLAVRDAGFNKVIYAAVTDAIPMPRKAIVKRENCNQCHESLGDPAGISLHGGSRRNTEYCVLCHNPNRTDEAARPEGQMPPVSVQYKRLIHRIHTGEEGEEPFIVYGAGGRAFDFSEVRFPGDRRNCEKCHIPGSQLINYMQVGAKPTVITQKGKVLETIPPIQAACLACHDNKAAKGHAFLQTTPQMVETCAVCHKEGREFAVSKAHAR